MITYRKKIFFLFFPGLLLLFLRDVALADVAAFSELNYSVTHTTAEDATGLTTTSKSTAFLQRYRIFLDRSITPTISLRASGIFEQSNTTTNVDGAEFKSENRRLLPSVDLTFNIPLFTADAGYVFREEKSQSGGAPPVTLIRETYTGLLGWRPVDLPSLGLTFTRVASHDKERSFQDVIIDTLTANTAYSPIKALNLNYQFSDIVQTDKLSGTDINQISHNGAADYANNFFGGRVTVAAGYGFNYFQSEITRTGAGTAQVNLPIFPFAGLFALNDMPARGALNPLPGLIDGNLTVSTGINLGVVSATGDTRPRNIGLDFFNQTEVNKVFIVIDRQLPAAIANSFSWDVYTSADNVNWNIVQANFQAIFNTFDNRFEITFPNVVTRYIKVVTRPLSLATAISVPGFQDSDKIFVTEMQAFLSESAAQAKRKTSGWTQRFNLASTQVILMNPSLINNLAYSAGLASTAGSGLTDLLTDTSTFNYRISPRLSTDARSLFEISRASGAIRYTAYRLDAGATYIFSRVFTGTATAGWSEVNFKNQPSISGLDYSASITAVPFPTLSAKLAYSHDSAMVGANGAVADSDSLFLYSSAALYKGIDVYLAGGLTSSHPINGPSEKAHIINAGVNLVPNPRLTINLNYGINRTKKSDGTENFNDGEGITVSYQPFQTLTLGASVSRATEVTNKAVTNTSYVVSWSPITGNVITFTTGYNEGHSTLNETDKSWSAGLTWRLLRNVTFNIAYSRTKSIFVSNTLNSWSILSNLRIRLL